MTFEKKKTTKVVKPASVNYVDAQKVLENYVNNPNIKFLGFSENQLGGITLNFQDNANNNLPVRLDRKGFMDVVKFGLEALAENNE